MFFGGGLEVKKSTLSSNEVFHYSSGPPGTPVTAAAAILRRPLMHARLVINANLDETWLMDECESVPASVSRGWSMYAHRRQHRSAILAAS